MNERLARRTVPWSAVSLLLGAGLLCIYASLTSGGRDDVGFMDLFNGGGMAAAVMWDIRVPRTLVAICIGVNLGVAGLILQAVTRNPLASPAVLGVNQGAALGLVLGLIFPSLAASFGLKNLAIIGAFSAGFITFAVAGGLYGRLDGLRLVLGGVAAGAFSYAMGRCR